MNRTQLRDAMRLSLRYSFTLAVVLSVTLLAVPSQASTLDQEQAAAQFSYEVGPDEFFKQLAQSFTAGANGTLAGVELRLGLLSGTATTGSVTVEIRNTMFGPASYGTGYTNTNLPGTNDIPPGTGVLLASTTLNASSLPFVDPSLGQTADFTSMITFSTPVTMTSGDHYSILLRTTGDTNFVWSMDFVNLDYTAGDGFARLGDGYAWSYVGFAGNPPIEGDFAFRTFVDGPNDPVPEPASLTLFGLGLAGLTRLRKRRS